MGRQKKDVDHYARVNKIALLNLNEPDYVSNLDPKDLMKDTVSFLLDYSLSHYKYVSSFVASHAPEFIINLHLPPQTIHNAFITRF